ncbi:hypothetical protein QOT17_025430 [Balamuthia mandrillaris]
MVLKYLEGFLASSLQLESKDSPTCVSSQDLHDLPLALQLEELPGIVATTVHEMFETGCNVNWTTDEWIENEHSSKVTLNHGNMHHNIPSSIQLNHQCTA